MKAGLHTLCFVTTFALTAAGSSGVAFAHDPAKTPATDHAAMGHSAGSMELHRIMTKGQSTSMPMSGDVDKDFATMMSMHHQQAIEMNAVLLKHSKNAELRALAQKMTDAQKKEIEQLAPHAK